MTDLRPWLALKSVPGVGNLLFRRLVNQFGSPEKVFEAEPSALGHVQGITPRLANGLSRYTLPDAVSAAIDRELETAAQNGWDLVPLTHPDYPALLRQIPDPPPVLYVYGTLPENTLRIAVVGSRHASGYGVSATRKLVSDLALQKVVIVSGMARGIDTVAHQAAMAAGAMTVAVLGTGLDCVYPKENERLFHQIADHGAVITEFSIGTRPDPHHFPVRNRIISGMCHGTVVVEAAGQSGSLITARLAAEQGREVFAVPGSIYSPKSAGTHNLIRQGAKLVIHAGDVIEEFSHVRPFAEKPDEKPDEKPHPLPLPSFSPDEARLMDRLETEPVHIDDLVRALELPAGRLSGLLLRLELSGLVVQVPGKRFALAPGVEDRLLRNPSSIRGLL